MSPDGRSFVTSAGMRQSSAAPWSGELWVVDLAAVRSARVFPGFSITSYDVSPDRGSVAFAALGEDRKLHIWLAALDARIWNENGLSVKCPERRLVGTNPKPVLQVSHLQGLARI